MSLVRGEARRGASGCKINMGHFCYERSYVATERQSIGNIRSTDLNSTLCPVNNLDNQIVASYPPVCCLTDDTDRRTAPVENETFQQARLLQRVPLHVTGSQEAGPVLHL